MYYKIVDADYNEKYMFKGDFVTLSQVEHLINLDAITRHYYPESEFRFKNDITSREEQIRKLFNSLDQPQKEEHINV